MRIFIKGLAWWIRLPRSFSEIKNGSIAHCNLVIRTSTIKDRRALSSFHLQLDRQISISKHKGILPLSFYRLSVKVSHSLAQQFSDISQYPFQLTSWSAQRTPPIAPHVSEIFHNPSRFLLCVFPPRPNNN